ncbi:MAG: hypothetical protein VX874_10730 [Pseudomonadota bacterium]|nr:hypothetical protein [Pseudomonadota bacterium]
MKNVAETTEMVRTLISEEPEGWAPPEAPLDMPEQTLERRAIRLDLTHLVRMMLPRQRI